MSKQTLLKDVFLLANETLDFIDDGWILLEDDAILDFGSGNAPAFCDSTYSFPGVLFMPAFTDAHTHIGDTLAKEAGVGRPTIEAVSPPDGIKYQLLRSASPEERIAAVRHGGQEMLQNGIGLIGDFREGGRDGAEILRKAFMDIPLETVTFGEPDWRELEQQSYQSLIPDVLEQSNGIGIGDAADFSEEDLRFLADHLGQKNKILAIHAAETQEAQDVCRKRWGKTEIERTAELPVDKILVHVTHPSNGCLDLIEAHHLPVVFCMRTNGILADGLPPVHLLLERGVRWGLGTDNMMFTSPDMFREMDLFSRVLRGTSGDPAAVDPREILAAATINGARILNQASRFGSITPGKTASIIGIDTNSRNLRYQRNIYSALVHRAGVQDIAQRVFKGRFLSNL